VPIVDDGGPLRLLLTRRSRELPTHKGHVAFPGGFVHPGEDDPAVTALREAGEEIGLSPDAVEILGLLDDHPTRSDSVAVSPVVGRLDRPPPLTPRSPEVARVFTIPFAVLTCPDRWHWRSAGRDVRLSFLEYDGEVLWGLSAAIVHHLLDLASPAPE
jgi:8-oxo-dGTP pyrophosphatase MutT (NUDIX family)